MTSGKVKRLSVGQRFGKWTVVCDIPYVRLQAYWYVRCDCGFYARVSGCNLRKGYSKACRSCCQETHGLTRGRDRHPLYSTWQGMLNRCRNSRQVGYRHYGGRGINVCERWSSFENFLADMGERPLGASLDRINVDGNYEPSNCRWATRTEQQRNRRCTVISEHIAQEILGRFEHGEPALSISKRLGIQIQHVRYCIMGGTHRDLHRPWVGRLPAEL